jgi:TolB-like protein
MKPSTGAVFLSYASQDAEAARRVCEALRAAGIEVWFDQDELRGGEAWDASIRKKIKECALFVPFISASTDARSEGYFRLEWKLAVDRSHLMAAERAFILPVVIDATADAEALVPDGFREVQWTRLPGGETSAAFVERVKGLLSPQGRVATVTPAAAAPGASRPAAGPAARPGLKRRPLLIGAVALVVLIALAVVATLKLGSRGDAIGSVAVLPFENATGDASLDYLGEGISESLINRLSGLSGLKVISRTSAFAFKGKKLDPMEIGRKLGVDALILGGLAQRGTNFAITAELVRVGDAAQLWGEKYSRRADDVQQVEAEIATTIVKTLKRQLSGEEKAKLTQVATTDPEAYRLYLKGRDFQRGSQREMDKSIDLLQQAVARAPDYALAHAGLAEAYTRQSFLRGSARAEPLEKARAALKRALELDPNLAEAHSALGLVRFYFEWDWAGAEAEFRRALELNPGSSAVHEEYGVFLTSMGRLDEGLARSREAARLDPLSVGPVHDLAINAMARGDLEEAAKGFRRAIDIDPNWTWGYVKLGRTLAMQKKCPEALPQAEIAEGRIAGGAAPLARSWLGVTFALCGDGARARQKLAELRALEKKQYVDPVSFAAIEGALGDMEGAMRSYEKAFEDRTPNMVYAAMAPAFSPEVVPLARYRAIVERMGFPKPAR